jgi:prephenate dehydrogenase
VAAVRIGPVSVIGLGVIGGSVAKALVRSGVRVHAFTASDTDTLGARAAGIDVAPDLEVCVANASVVLIAVPISAHVAVAANVVAAARADAVLLHSASLQSAPALVAAAPAGMAIQSDVVRRVIGTHPLAGSHRSGFSAADVTLFQGRVVSIEDRADADARAAAERLWRAVGANRFEYRSADEHDRLMTWVSHLPQLASTVLADAIARAGVPSDALGPGGRDATRLAASPFETWRGILAGARLDAAEAMTNLERSAHALRSALESSDFEAIERLWMTARRWRDSADEKDNAGGEAAQ